MKLNKEQLRVLSNKITEEYVKDSYDPNIQKELDSIYRAYQNSGYKNILSLFGYDPSVNSIISAMNPDFHKRYCGIVSKNNKGIYSFNSSNISLKSNYCHITYRRVQDVLILATINPKNEVSDIISSIVNQLKAEDEKNNS